MNKPVKVTKDMVERSLMGNFQLALSERDVTPEKLAEKLAEELEATDVKLFYDRAEKKVVQSEPLVDWKTRQEARRDATKLLGLIPKEQGPNVTLNFFTQIVEAADPMKR